jgi:hypothetical protein
MRRTRRSCVDHAVHYMYRMCRENALTISAGCAGCRTYPLRIARVRQTLLNVTLVNCTGSDGWSRGRDCRSAGGTAAKRHKKPRRAGRAEFDTVRILYRACDGCDDVIRPRLAAGVLVTVSLGRGQRWVSYPGLRAWLRRRTYPGLFSVAPSGAKPE